MAFTVQSGEPSELLTGTSWHWDRTHNTRVVAAIKDGIEGLITTDTQGFAINGRAVSQIPIEELHRLKGLYAAAVGRERTGKIGPSVSVSFVDD
jgi:hypothetical protein